MTSFIDSAEARNKTLGAYDSQAHDSAVAEVGLILTASTRTAAARVGRGVVAVYPVAGRPGGVFPGRPPKTLLEPR